MSRVRLRFPWNIVLFLGVFLPFLLAATCPGFSKDPEISKIQQATVTCASITGAINTLTFMKRGGSLSETQIQQVDLTIKIVQPICGVVSTSGDLIDLDALSAQLAELQRLTGGGA